MKTTCSKCKNPSHCMQALQQTVNGREIGKFTYVICKKCVCPLCDKNTAMSSKTT